MILRNEVNLNLHEEEPFDKEALSQHIRRECDFFEADILDYLRDNHPNHRTIIDIGANIGNHTVYFANYLKYDRIIAFEPESHNFDILLSNISTYPNIYEYKVALSDHRGVEYIEANPTNMGNSALNASNSMSNGGIPVLVYPLDSYWFESPTTLLKIDVEGHEKQVLRGAKESIARDHPLILIEQWEELGDELPGYELEKWWQGEFTYLYRWANA